VSLYVHSNLQEIITEYHSTAQTQKGANFNANRYRHEVATKGIFNFIFNTTTLFLIFHDPNDIINYNKNILNYSNFNLYCIMYFNYYKLQNCLNFLNKPAI
jgi:hypothetical protein